MKHLVIFLLCLIPGFVFSQTKIRIELLNPDPNYTYRINGTYWSSTNPEFTNFGNPDTLIYDTIQSTGGIFVWGAFIPFPPNVQSLYTNTTFDIYDNNGQFVNGLNGLIITPVFEDMIRNETITHRVMMFEENYEFMKKDSDRVARTDIVSSFKKELLQTAPKILSDLKLEDVILSQDLEFSDSNFIEFPASDVVWLNDSEFRGFVKWVMCYLVTGIRFVEEQERFCLDLREEDNMVKITIHLQ